MANVFDLQPLLQGLMWPASKSEIIEHAKGQGAGEEHLALLERLPDQDFTSDTQVSQTLGAYGPSS
jgi:hypothetical protein